jgi:hypothetical protein
MPDPPVRQFSFTDFQVSNPTAPPPGDRLDAEFDRANSSITDTITWAGTSLNTDGSLRDAIVGQNNLAPGLFDGVSSDIIDEVQPLVDEAHAYADAALTSANTADDAAASATLQSTAAQGAASDAWASATTASTARDDAQTYAGTAQAAASDASNDANHAAGDAAASEDYAVLAQAWAEHMPDPIPPNILAVMNITGDHWSSRWWANKATNAFGQLSELYLGVWPTPPTTTSTGDPIPIGAIYYNSTTNQPFVWTGTEWQPFWAPAKAYTISLIYQATGGQTHLNLTTPDINGNVWVINPADPELLEVFANGVRLLNAGGVSPGDWSVNNATSIITFTTPMLAGTMILVDILAPAGKLAPSAVTTQLLLDFDIDPITGNPGQIDGTRTTFNLALATDRSLVTVTLAVEVQIFIDGITQKPGVDYNVSGDTITFGEAPTPGGTAWGLWFAKPPPSALLALPDASPAPIPQPDAHACVCPVGTMLTSVLDPDQFAAELGDRAADWVPADGRDITGTRLAALLNTDTAPVWRAATALHTYHYVRVN